MTEMSRQTASVGIRSFPAIPDRNKVRFRNEWQRFRTFLSRVPELKRIEASPNDPQHAVLINSGLNLTDERIDDYKAIFEFQEMLIHHTDHFESNKTLHVSKI